MPYIEELYNEGVLRAIGVSNFYPDRLVDIASFANIVPMVNQVETHVLNHQKVAKEYMDKYGVQCEAWAPFGEGRGGLFENETLINIGKKIRQDRCSGHAPLEHSARCCGTAEVHTQRAYDTEHRRFRLHAL